MLAVPTQNQRQIQLLAAVLLDSLDGIIVQDPGGRILVWNQGAELMYGYQEDEALGMDIAALPNCTKNCFNADFQQPARQWKGIP